VSQPIATDVSTRLEQLRREADREWHARQRERAARSRPAPRRRPLGIALATVALSIIVLGALPFVALIRGSLYLQQLRGWPAGIALTAAVLASAGLVALYLTWLVRRFTGRVRARVLLLWVALPVVACHAGYALAYVSSANLKHDRLRAHYTSLHPGLRVALATLILVDRELILTDFQREPDDYAAMGLRVNPASQHYPQRDGWAHAVDLRTVGRGWLRNAAVEWYFRAMGFATLRHVGTADHLHVAVGGGR
jgi:hypothetical protein